MAEQQTQTQDGTPAAAGSSSGTAVSNGASDSLQTSNTATVDSGNDGGKSTASDDAGGAAGDGDGQRPGRAERRISELTKRIKESEAELEQKNSLIERLSQTPVDQSKINFPDYSGVEQITPDQLKKDILATANQLVDARMSMLGSELLNRVDQKEVTAKSSDAIKSTITKYSVLNPESDDYDHDLDLEISTAYAEARANSPSYSFSTFIKPFERVLDQSSTTSKDASTTGPRGRAAPRSRSVQSRTGSNDFPANGTAAEMEKWFANNR